jgi:hypothetical protein
MGLLLGFGLFQRDELGLGPRALSSLSMVSRSCRCHTQRTPAGETVRPRFLSWLATRTWPIRLRLVHSGKLYVRKYLRGERAVREERLWA